MKTSDVQRTIKSLTERILMHRILESYAEDIEVFVNGGPMSYDLEVAIWDYLYDTGVIRNYNCTDCYDLIRDTLVNEVQMKV
jgi:hypothetical protein